MISLPSYVESVKSGAASPTANIDNVERAPLRMKLAGPNAAANAASTATTKARKNMIFVAFVGDEYSIEIKGDTHKYVSVPRHRFRGVSVAAVSVLLNKYCNNTFLMLSNINQTK